MMSSPAGEGAIEKRTSNSSPSSTTDPTVDISSQNDQTTSTSTREQVRNLSSEDTGNTTSSTTKDLYSSSSQQQRLPMSDQEADTSAASSKNENNPKKDAQLQSDSFDVDWSSENLFGHRRYLFREFLDVVNQFRYNCGMLVNNGHVQLFIILLIAINGIMMGVATFDFVSDNQDIADAFETVDLIFLIIFTVELGLQFIYHGWRLLLDGWLIFDLVIIITSWSFSSVQIIRAFRIFRALRLVTRIKIMKNLILALFSVMPRMAAIGLMLFLIFYIFAVMFTQLFKDLYKDELTDYDYFSRIDGTFFTLFQIMTLDNWADVARQVIAVFTWAWVPFIAFVIISGFIVVNLIIAVICDAISALHADDKAKIQGNFQDDEDTDEASYEELEIREQLDGLEEQMEELTRIQAKAFHTLQYLTRQVQMHKLKVELREKNDLKSVTLRKVGGGDKRDEPTGGGVEKNNDVPPPSSS